MLKKLLKITKQITQYVDSKSVKIDCPYSADLGVSPSQDEFLGHPLPLHHHVLTSLTHLGVSPSQDELLGHSLPLLHLVLSSLTHLRLGILS